MVQVSIASALGTRHTLKVSRALIWWYGHGEACTCSIGKPFLGKAIAIVDRPVTGKLSWQARGLLRNRLGIYEQNLHSATFPAFPTPTFIPRYASSEHQIGQKPQSVQSADPCRPCLDPKLHPGQRTVHHRALASCPALSHSIERAADD